jgi:hypothetical protein
LSLTWQGLASPFQMTMSRRLRRQNELMRRWSNKSRKRLDPSKKGNALFVERIIFSIVQIPKAHAKSAMNHERSRSMNQCPDGCDRLAELEKRIAALEMQSKQPKDYVSEIDYELAIDALRRGDRKPLDRYLKNGGRIPRRTT